MAKGMFQRALDNISSGIERVLSIPGRVVGGNIGNMMNNATTPVMNMATPLMIGGLVIGGVVLLMLIRR